MDPDNAWSSGLHLDGLYSKNDIKAEFCLTPGKGHYNKRPWPKGKYCIFRSQTPCENFGMSEGEIFWDDEDVGNINEVGGFLPKGFYTRNTIIRFCCMRDDSISGDDDKPINLPPYQPFYLLQYGDLCPLVTGMRLTPEWVVWDTEDVHSLNRAKDVTPKAEIGPAHIKLYYCYYTPML